MANAPPVTTIVELLARLPSTQGVIAVDGYHGSGKTTLALALSDRIGLPVVHLDDFLERDRGHFVAALRYGELEPVVRDRRVIVEGVCVLTVLERMGVLPDAMIYVDDSPPPPTSPRGRGPLAAEVAAYHTRVRPREMATLIYAPWHEEPNMRDADIDIAFINAKTRIAITLAIGGMVTLLVGLILLFYGASGTDTTLVRIAGAELSASGLGGVIMVTSVAWAFLAYQARPKYSRSREVSEKFDENKNLLERSLREASTQMGVGTPDRRP